jgi:hypothetical protein
MQSDDRQKQQKPDHGQKRNNNSTKKKGNQRLEMTEQVFTVSKADFERLNNWKADKAKQSKGSSKAFKPSTTSSTRSSGICYKFQN